MKNVTLALDDETWRLARIAAAERDTSVSALVRDALRQLARTSDNQRKADLFAALDRAAPNRAADRPDREEVHARRAD